VQAEEDALGLNDAASYTGMATKVDRIVADFRNFLAMAKSEGKTVAGYGAAAKGNTFLNVAKIGPQDGIAFVVDRNPSKQNTLLPGSHIPVLSPDAIALRRPDYLVILPWNIAPEVITQEARIRDWGGQFVTAIPSLKIQ
jgi:C-methyltransferase C-terminal domain